MAPRLRTYPGAQGKVNACGGGRKTKHEWYRGRQTSNEAGKPHREVGKPLACSHGEMSQKFLVLYHLGTIFLYPSRIALSAPLDIRSPPIMTKKLGML